MASSIMAGGLLGLTSASAKTTPVLIVKPAVNLKMVRCDDYRHGFKPGDTVFLVECQRTAKGQSDAMPRHLAAADATISSSGKLPSTKFKVTTGKVGPGKCGTKEIQSEGMRVECGQHYGAIRLGPIVFK